MSETQFLIGQNGLNFESDFYPDDLPEEWRFDYYATQFKALSLPIDSTQDLPQILAELEHDDEEFALVLSISYAQLTDTGQLSALLSKVADYQLCFILFCQVDAAPKHSVMDLLAGYRFCFQSKHLLKLDLKHARINEKYFAFNQYPILICDEVFNELQTRIYLQKIADINHKSILIFTSTGSETLQKTRVISELLGF